MANVNNSSFATPKIQHKEQKHCESISWYELRFFFIARFTEKSILYEEIYRKIDSIEKCI